MVEPRERIVPLVSVKICAICPSCREGDLMWLEGQVSLTDPPKFLHRCVSCGHEAYVTGKRYPYLDYRDVH